MGVPPAVALGVFCCRSGLLTVAGGPLSGRMSSVVAAHGLGCPVSREILVPLTDQGVNPHPIHYKADSYTLERQGSPSRRVFLFPDPGESTVSSAGTRDTYPVIRKGHCSFVYTYASNVGSSSKPLHICRRLSCCSCC